MRDIVLRIGLFMISTYEVWLCYQFMYLTILKERYMTRMEKGISWVNILVLGMLLSINRTASFFSYTMFVFCIIVTSIFVWCIRKKDFLWIIGMCMLYYSIVSWMDMFFAFIGMQILQGRVISMLCMYGTTYVGISVVIFSLSRLIISVILYSIYQRKTVMYPVEYRGTFIAIGTVLCVILRRYQLVFDGMGTGEQKMQAVQGSISLITALGIVIIGGIFVTKYKLLKREQDFLHLKDELMEDKYQIMMKNQHMAHDMKNQMIILKEYCHRKKWEKLAGYIEELGGDYMNASLQLWTGNRILDLLLNQKMEKAKSEGIKVDINVGVIHKIPLSDSELISIYGNLLDNAIEACIGVEPEERKIEIRTEKRKDILFIEVSNTFAETPVIKNGEFVTNKQGKESHGYGIKSVKRIVDKYDGLFSYQIKEDIFQVNITFFDSEIDYK